MRKRRGFTLIELLVVIAIIALLMSILMPALARVRKQAKESMCMSNLKQWGGAFSMYTGEWDGSFHMGWMSGTRHRWYLALRAYYGNQTELLMCPMATQPLVNYGADPSGGIFNTWDGGTHDEQHYYGSYGICSCLPNSRNPSTDTWKRDDIKGASQVPLLVDAQWFTSYPWWTNQPPEYEGARWRSGGGGGGMGTYCIPRHGEKINGLFVDYSVRSIGLKELWLLHWCRGYRLQMDRAKQNEPDWSSGTGWMVPFRDYDYIRAGP